jgi:hypothetical protein
MAEQMVFPRVTGYGGVDVVSTQGLSVREYFAAMALQGLLAAGGADPERQAEKAFKFADAFIQASKHPGELET